MSTIQDVSAEQLARIFHHYHEALSQDRDCHGNGESCNSWERASQSERNLMLAAARLALLELTTTPPQPGPGRKYYAKPGEAEWGC